MDDYIDVLLHDLSLRAAIRYLSMTVVTRGYDVEWATCMLFKWKVLEKVW